MQLSLPFILFIFNLILTYLSLFLYRNGDLVLVDCGAELNGYASDITRTWPVNGKFTDPQRELYQVVLNVQKKCIKVG